MQARRPREQVQDICQADDAGEAAGHVLAGEGGGGDGGGGAEGLEGGVGLGACGGEMRGVGDWGVGEGDGGGVGGGDGAGGRWGGGSGG